MLDKTGRKIEYLRISLTDRCNLRCIYCMPEEGIKKLSHDDIMRFEDFEKVISACASIGIKKVRFTGGEPLILKGIERLISYTASLKEIEDISLTTNGILLEGMADKLLAAGLNRVNISLDTLDENKYRTITRGGNLGDVFKSIDKCLNIGLVPVKINTVLMKGINDDEIDAFIGLTRSLPVDVRFIELMPIGEGLKYYSSGSMSVGEILDRRKELIPAESKSSVASAYRLEGAKGMVGFISPMSCKFCRDCNRIRLTSTGTLKPCLHSREEISLRPYLDDYDMLVKILKDAVYNKPEEHHLNEQGKSDTPRDMYQIGG